MITQICLVLAFWGVTAHFSNKNRQPLRRESLAEKQTWLNVSFRPMNYVETGISYICTAPNDKHL